MTRAAALIFAVGILVIVSASNGRASLYHPEDRTGVVQVDEKGAPEAYPFDEFKRRRLELRNTGNPDWPLKAFDPQTKQLVMDPRTNAQKLTERGVVDQRVSAALKKKKRTSEETAALAVDLLRLNKAAEAEGVFETRNGYLPNITLAHIAVAQGQWGRAYEFLDIANEEPYPKELPGVKPEQLAWQRKLNNGPLKTLIHLRWKESQQKLPPENELPDAIWPVKLVNDAGQYEPGKLVAAEKAKLPGGDFPEAIATVQQLVLWFPFDVRLYWLLGELYAAKGEVRSALDIMNECVDSGRYSNRKVLMEHREAVAKAVSELPPEGQLTPDNPPPPAVPFSFREVWIYLGVVGVIALFALVRSLVKLRKA